MYRERIPRRAALSEMCSPPALNKSADKESFEKKINLSEKDAFISLIKQCKSRENQGLHAAV